jgi:putative membrane protein
MVMALITQEQQQQIADLIADIERRTDAEFVAVLARRSDDYSYIPLLWAAVTALLVPLLLIILPVWPTLF